MGPVARQPEVQEVERRVGRFDRPALDLQDQHVATGDGIAPSGRPVRTRALALEHRRSDRNVAVQSRRARKRPREKPAGLPPSGVESNGARTARHAGVEHVREPAHTRQRDVVRDLDWQGHAQPWARPEPGDDRWHRPAPARAAARSRRPEAAQDGRPGRSRRAGPDARPRARGTTGTPRRRPRRPRLPRRAASSVWRRAGRPTPRNSRRARPLRSRPAGRCSGARRPTARRSE